MIDVINLITKRLKQQGIKAELAEELATIFSYCALDWLDDNPGKISDARSIIVLAHSFHQDILGNKTSGPINKMLAELTIDYYNKLKVHIFAQWEVGVLLIDRIPSEHLSVIYPKIDDSTGFQYLSTLDVINTAIDKHHMHPDDHSPTLIICHKWHTIRCIRYLQNDPRTIYHFDTVTDQKNMPETWDSEAGLIWASTGQSHMISHIISTLADYRNQLMIPAIREKKEHMA